MAELSALGAGLRQDSLIICTSRIHTCDDIEGFLWVSSEQCRPAALYSIARFVDRYEMVLFGRPSGAVGVAITRRQPNVDVVAHESYTIEEPSIASVVLGPYGMH